MKPLPGLNNTELEEIQAMAELFYTPEEISENLEIDYEDFRQAMARKDNEIYRAFRMGWISGDMKLRKGIALAAEHGSNPAQQMLMQLKEKSEIKLQSNE